MIEIRNLTFGYRTEPLFERLDLELRPGNVYGLLGINGAGKSTLLRLIAGLLFKRGGSIRSLGRDPAEREPSLLSEIFMLPEQINIPSITSRAYLAARTPFYARFDAERFTRYADAFELPPAAKLSGLSYGQQKKFLIAFGLASGSSVVLLDEPTNGLDIPSKAQLRRALAEAATPERLIVISTHQVRDVGALIDPVVMLHGGRIALNRSVSEIGARIRMTLGASPPDPRAPHLIHSEPAVGGFWSVWDDAGPSDEQLDLEVLFNALVSQPERCASVLGMDGARA